ncbi:MAG: hypothetical protein ACOY82_07555 [Pseudomonadota bacterium]
MREILEIGGSGFLIPAVIFLLVLYAAKGLYGLVGHRSRHRKEFLDLWDPVRAQDDLWLEVVVRHHFGTTMPAGVIRLALAQPDKSLALFELCELWPLLRYDRNTQSVAWLHQWHVSQNGRRMERRVMSAGYYALMLAAVGYVFGVTTKGPDSFVGWIYAFGAVVFAALALVTVARHSTMTTATDSGDEWVQRINQNRQPAPPSEPPNV